MNEEKIKIIEKDKLNVPEKQKGIKKEKMNRLIKKGKITNVLDKERKKNERNCLVE